MIKNYLLIPILLFYYNTQAQTANTLQQKITQLSNQSDLSGFTVSIVNADSVLFSKGYGYSNKEQKVPYQTDHVQIIASISKTWIGLALMQCVEQGKFSLDTDVNDLLPFKVINPNYPNQPITVRHLATHTSSIIYSIPDHDKIVFEEKPNMKHFRGREKRVVNKILKNLEKRKQIEHKIAKLAYIFLSTNIQSDEFINSSRVRAQIKESNCGSPIVAN